MANIKTVGIKTLKDNLSAYLREVRAGSQILVTDRSEVVAEITRPARNRKITGRTNSVLDEWIEQGWLIPPKSAKQKCIQSPLRLDSKTVQRLLDEDRDP